MKINYLLATLLITKLSLMEDSEEHWGYEIYI